MSRLCGPSYYELLSYDYVWSEGMRISSLSDDECEMIGITFSEFPLHSKVEFDCEPVKGLTIKGNGRVVGYLFRPATDLFSVPSVNLLVFSQTGLVKCRKYEAKRIN